ncbi:MAG: divalent-cation tolerance protein CutA [Caulobacteraceae bacterium]|nr:divalent-cation tolerance protein CutA [Caulobacteraceae bacterium]
MTGAIVVSTTAGSAKEAEAIADVLLEQRLAACVQMIPIESRYAWQGEVARASEVLLLVKTQAPLFDKVAAAIRAVHSYETPEIIATTVSAGSADYLRWIADSTGDVIG